jgi:hypothetical protein
MFGHREVVMNLKRAFVLWAFVVSASAVAAWTPAQAQQSQRIRGEIENVQGNTITVKTDEGKTVKVVLADNYTVSHAVRIALSDIKPGTFVGVGGFPDGDVIKAAHVQVFPPKTNARERHGPWSADPSGTMTNAKATAVVVGQSEGKLTLTLNGKNYEIKVPPEAPVVRTEAGTKDLVKPGAWVGISNAVEKNGVLSAKSILVSDDRRYPVR